MKWLPAVLVAALLTAGCRTPAPTFDPFAGRTTVPPPGTGTIDPAAGQPYYQGAPPPGAAPTTTYPDTAPPGGYGYPQGSLDSTGAAALAGAEPRAAADGVVHLNESAIRVPGDNEPRRIQLANAPNAIMPTTAAAAPLAMQSRAPVVLPRQASPSQPIPIQPQARPLALGSTPAARVAPAMQYAVAPVQFAPNVSTVDPCAGAPARFAPQGPVEITQLPARTSHVAAQTPTLAARADTGFRAPTSRTAVQTVSHETPVEADFQPPVYRYGYESNYQWIKGELEYLRSTRTWKLRYIPIDGDTDEYGGSVEIANADLLAGYQPGDHVTLHGRITREPDDAGSFAPLYTIDRAAPLE